jgi:peroxiredoxin
MSTYAVVPERPLAIGDEAPNFDLASTEDVVLMLRDEVPRTAVVLYFFADPAAERVRRDLAALSRHRDAFQRRRAKALAVAPSPLAELKLLQRELGLTLPLLHDDRGFLAVYGVAPPSGDAAGGERPAAPALFVVDRRQRLLWLANPVAAVEEALPQIDKLLAAQPSPTALYPRSVVNRLVDRWVNR